MTLTRRTLMVGAGAGALLAAAGPALAAPEGDSQVTGNAVRDEQVTVAAYGAILGATVLGAKAGAVVTEILVQEQQHLDAFTTVYEQFGLKPAAPPKDAAAIDVALGRLGVTRRLAGVSDEDSALALLIELEEAVRRRHAHGQQFYAAARLIQITGSVLTAEGSHLAALRHLAGAQELPNALPV